MDESPATTSKNVFIFCSEMTSLSFLIYASYSNMMYILPNRDKNTEYSLVGSENRAKYDSKIAIMEINLIIAISRHY